MRGELFTELVAGKARVRVAPLEVRPRRAVADHVLGTRQVQAEVIIQRFLHRHPADIHPDRPRIGQVAGIARPEQLRVDATRPAPQVGKPVLLQIARLIGRRHHRVGSAPVEPAEKGVAQRERHRCTLAYVLRELRVVRRGVALIVAHAVAARSESQRAFSSDVNTIGREFVELPADRAVRAPGQADFRIGRTGKGAEVAGVADAHVVPHLLKRLGRAAEGCHNAVHLGAPGVCNDRYPHAVQFVERM